MPPTPIRSDHEIRRDPRRIFFGGEAGCCQTVLSLQSFRPGALTWVFIGQQAPSRPECVKFIFDVSSSQRCWRAASSDSMRWSAMSGSPESSYCFSKSWHSSSKHGVYVGRKPRRMEWRAVFFIAPQKRWYDSSTLMLLRYDTI